MDGQTDVWRWKLADCSADLEEGAVGPGGMGRDALHDGVKAVQLLTLVKQSKFEVSPVVLFQQCGWLHETQVFEVFFFFP